MARIKYSALVSDMRNKLNGSVLSVNRAGSYIRNKVTPINPQTPYQQAVRARFAEVSSKWKTLSQSRRDGFSNFAKEFPYTDIFGDQKHLDGKAMYVKLASDALLAGGSTPTEAPDGTAVPAVQLKAIEAKAEDSAVNQALKITTDLTTSPIGTVMAVYATPPMSLQKGFVKNQFRFIGYKTIASATTDILEIYKARFGDLQNDKIGMAVHVRVRNIATFTGLSSLPASISGVFESGEE